MHPSLNVTRHRTSLLRRIQKSGFGGALAIAVAASTPLCAHGETTVTAWGRPVVTNVPLHVRNVVDVAAGDGFVVALLADGSLAAWGTNSLSITNVPPGLTNVLSVSASGRHVVVLQRDGTIAGWGSDSASQTRLAPSNCIAVSAGPLNNLGLTKDGRVASWPDRFFAPPGGLSNIVGIAAGGRHGLAISSGGEVVAWGNNSAGQTDVPPGLSNVVSVAAGEQFSAALTGEGTLWIWGANTYARLPDLSKAGAFTSLAASRYHLLARRADGSVFAWGANFSGQTNVPPGLSPATLIAAGDNVSVAVGGDVPPHIHTPLFGKSELLGASASFAPRISGSTPLSFQWTFNGEPIIGATEPVLSFGRLTLADSGSYSLLVSNHAGTDISAQAALDVSQVMVWGADPIAPTNVPPGLTNLVALSGGTTHLVGLRRDGTVVTWGSRAPEIPAGLTNIVAVSAGDAFSVALTAEGKVVVWGRPMAGPLIVPPGLSDVKAIASGFSQVVALKSDGTVTAWGPEGAKDFSAPPGLENVVAVAASYNASAALTADGRIVTWPEATSVLAPDNPANITNAVALVGATSVSVHHMLALLEDGKIAVWGFPRYQYLPPLLTGVERLVGAGSHDFALLENGTIAAWGSSAGGLTNIPPGLPTISEIAGTGGSVVLMVGVGAPHIVEPLLNRRVAAGSSVALKVRATGENPLSYQWSYEGAPIAGATNSLLVLPAVTLAASGTYSLVVSNAAGVVQDDLSLSVLPAVVTQHPLSVTNLFGSAVVFETRAQGENLRYQWQYNGQDLPGETNDVLRIENAGHGQAGMYRAIIQNEEGAVHTREAALNLQSVGYWGAPAGAEASAFATSRTNILGISAGAYGSLAIDDSLTALPLGETNIIGASAAYYFSLLLRADGTVDVVGENPAGPTEPPADLTNVVAVAAGYYHALALRSDGTVVAWGDDRYGVTNVPSGLRDVVAVAAGHELSLALTADGTVVQWGDTNELFALPAGLTNITRIASSLTASIALRDDGTVVTWGMYDLDRGPADPPPATLSNVVAIAAGATHFLALTRDGEVVAWGWNDQGQGTVPSGIANVQAIGAGFYHNLVLTGSQPPVPKRPLKVLSRGDDAEFQVAVQSTLNSVFALEYADSLETANWTRLPLVAGNGREIILRDPSISANARFYRVRRW